MHAGQKENEELMKTTNSFNSLQKAHFQLKVTEISCKTSLPRTSQRGSCTKARPQAKHRHAQCTSGPLLDFSPKPSRDLPHFPPVLLPVVALLYKHITLSFPSAPQNLYSPLPELSSLYLQFVCYMHLSQARTDKPGAPLKALPAPSFRWKGTGRALYTSPGSTWETYKH